MTTPGEGPYDVVTEEILIEPPEDLDDSELEAWIDGYQTAMGLVADAAETFYAALNTTPSGDAPMSGVPPDAGAGDNPDPDPPTPPGEYSNPPCPDCGQETRPAMGGIYHCFECDVELALTSDPR